MYLLFSWFLPLTSSSPCRKDQFAVSWFSLINIELNLFQELESAVHWPDGDTMLIGLSPWTGWYSIFWWPLIRTPLGRETGVCHFLNPSAYGFAQKSSGVEIAVCQRWPTPGWYGFAHALETGQAVGWCTCANCRYACYNATRYLLTFSTNGVVQEP